jgi:hypothetical protein
MAVLKTAFMEVNSGFCCFGGGERLAIVIVMSQEGLRKGIGNVL